MTTSGSWYCTTNFNSSVGNSYAGTALWFGPYLNLAPGSYVANFSLYTTDNRSSNFMTLDVSGNSGTDVIDILPVPGTRLVSHEWTTVPIRFNLSNFLPNVEFRGFTQNWTGTRCLSQVSLTQLQGGVPSTLPLRGQGVPQLLIPHPKYSVPSAPLERTAVHAALGRTGVLAAPPCRDTPAPSPGLGRLPAERPES